MYHHPTMYALVYASVATQKYWGKRIEQQVEKCKQWASKKKAIVIQGVYKDEGIAKTSLDRPGLQEAIALIERQKASKKPISYFITTGIDRISRDFRSYVRLEELMDANGVQIVEVEKNSLGHVLVQETKFLLRLMRKFWKSL